MKEGYAVINETFGHVVMVVDHPDDAAMLVLECQAADYDQVREWFPDLSVLDAFSHDYRVQKVKLKGDFE